MEHERKEMCNNGGHKATNGGDAERKAGGEAGSWDKTGDERLRTIGNELNDLSQRFWRRY